MQNRRNKSTDIICAGELLVDLMTTDYADKLDGNRMFRPAQGGSPANLCLNMARLGNSTRLVSTIGNDDIGNFLYESVQKGGVDCSLIRRTNQPSTLILVSHSLNVPSFEAYRTADQHITSEQFPPEVLENASLFHTTCFGLSLPPAQQSILQAAEKAAASGSRLSIDANYAKKIWSNQEEAQSVVAKYVSHGALVKVSEVDWQRLYGKPLHDPKEAGDFFLRLGASQVCVTMGAEGAYLATAEENYRLPSRKVTVRDTTGAGDAFWSGFLTAYLDGLSPLDCLKAGRKMAEIKLAQLGPLNRTVAPAEIYQD